ncbi:MAG: 3-hydroxyacyl-CoA dehydrogenase NAD-binding domain-containing protein [Pseudomonadota bacterium]
MREIHRVAVIGGGVIGKSWASLCLARGLQVVVVDPRKSVENDLSVYIERAWPLLQALDLVVDGASKAPEFSTEISSLVGIDFVAECGPERIEFKHDIVEQLEAVIEDDVMISSSTSSLKPSDIQRNARVPSRLFVGHPMNPPHTVPMVELVAGEKTDPAVMSQAEDFYRERLDRVTIRVQKEVVGHLANRLTSALYREAVNIVAEGIGRVEDVDKAIAYGPGMRWALMGPHLTYHMGGGDGGYRNYLDHFGPTQEARWRELGTPAITESLKSILVSQLDEELSQQDTENLAGRRDEALVELLHLKKRYGF